VTAEVRAAGAARSWWRPDVAAAALLAAAVAAAASAFAYPSGWTAPLVWLLCGACAGYAASGST
jgi:hypothetical protein